MHMENGTRIIVHVMLGETGLKEKGMEFQLYGFSFFLEGWGWVRDDSASMGCVLLKSTHKLGKNMLWGEFRSMSA